MAKTSGITPDKILAVAETLISVKGINNTSLSDIAKAAGISKGTLYYHFQSKELIIYELASRFFDVTHNRLLKWVQDFGGKVSPNEILRMFFESSIEETHFEKLHVTLIQEVLTGNEELKTRFVQRYIDWEQAISESLSKLYGSSSVFIGSLLMALIEGYSLRRIITGTSPDYKLLSVSTSEMLAAVKNEHNRNTDKEENKHETSI